MKSPIGVFDSGFGGLTVLREFVKQMPQYDYLYLGDNARSPYGTRSFETVYHYTLEAVEYLFGQGCELVILACNTASAKALRNIQQLDLERIAPQKRVLGVIRPTAEVIGGYSKTKQIGVFATAGTVASGSYLIEINHFFSDAVVHQEACPMWVPLVENGEANGAGADFFVKQHIDNLLKQSPDIDTILLGCTHYPLLIDKIRQFTPAHIQVVSQGEIVAQSLKNYLDRHPEIETRCSKNSQRAFHTTDAAENFDRQSALFFGQAIQSQQVVLF
jgi:glutamate racemase